MKPKKKAAPPKGNYVKDSVPEDAYKKVAKKSVKARKADKK